MFGLTNNNKSLGPEDPGENFQNISSNQDEVDLDTPLPDHPDIPSNLKFVPPGQMTSIINGLAPNTIGSLSQRNDRIGRIAKEAIRAKSLYDRLSEGDKSAIGDAVSFAAQTLADVQGAARAVGMTPGIQVEAPEPPPPLQGSSGGHASHHSLSLTPEPTSIRLDTGIRQLFYSPNYLVSEQSHSHTGYGTAVRFALPTVTTTDLGYWTANSVISDLRNTVAKNINYPLSQAPLFTTSNILTYFNNVISALSMYYCVKRYFVWGVDPKNKNDSLYYMRGTITSVDLQRYLALERLLDGIPIPPRLNEFIFWMHQIYSSGKLPGSPVITIDRFTLVNGVPDWSEMSTLVTNLNSDTMYQISNAFSRAFPTWDKTVLMTGTANPEYDDNFITLWRNLPFVQGGTTPVSHDLAGPFVANATAQVRYNTWTDELDGAIPGLLCATTSAVQPGSWLPSLLVPFFSTTLTANNSTNRYHYGFNGTTYGWYDSYNDDVALTARDETYATSYRFVNLSNVAHVCGSEKLLQVTPISAAETAEAIVDYLMSWDTMDTKSDRSLSPGNRRPKINSYRRNKKKEGGK